MFLIAGLIKKILQMSSKYFPPYRGHIADVKFRLDLTTKTDSNDVTHVDTSGFAFKTNLASLKK